MARPSKYDREIKPHLDDIRKAVEAGATVEEIAEAFKIAPSTIYKYKKEKKEFSEAFARGREKVIIDIKAALLKKFKSIKAIAAASVEELCGVVPKNTAEAIYGYFHAESGE